MFIQTEQTPNPETLKFLPGQTLLEAGTADFPDPESAERAPLAQRLFAVAGVARVFIGADFVTITKGDGVEWQTLKPLVLGALMDHLTAGAPILADGATAAAETAQGDDDEVVTQIKDLLDTRVRPAVAQDGGDIVYHGFEDGVVYLHMQGSCAGCPSSTATLKMGIENLLRHYVPEVQRVEAIN